MPGLVVLRPADANETVWAWKYALERRDGPTALVLTRQKAPVLDQKEFASASGLLRGAYVLTGAGSRGVILLASGSEVHLAVAAHRRLNEMGIASRVVSMPSWELFEAESAGYRDSVLPAGVTARVAIEAGVPLRWERYLGPRGVFVGMRSFGASAPSDVLFRNYGMTVETIVQAAQQVIS